MTSAYHNCFFYYRGPTSRSAGEEAERFHQQVEDNTTKALVNTLEHSEAEVAAGFLRRFAVAPLASRLTRPLEFHLQHAPEEALDERRALLGISILGEADPSSFASGANEKGSKIDAAIRSPRPATLLIETKTVDYLDGAQLNRHAERWRLPCANRGDGEWRPPASWSFARWADIWRWARDARSETNAGSVTEFLLRQFAEYLEILGFAPWAGFREEDFAFFAAPTPERQVVLRNKMAGLWERVFEALTPAERQRLGAIHAGRFGRTRDPAWAQTNRGESGANLTVELNARELQLNLVGWDAAQAHAVKSWVEGPGRTEIPSGAELVVWERQAKRARSGKPFWMGARVPRSATSALWRSPPASSRAGVGTGRQAPTAASRPSPTTSDAHGPDKRC